MFAIHRALLGCALLGAAAVASAQVATPAVSPVVSSGRILPAGTLIKLTPMEELASSKVKVGDRYKFTVVEDVVEQGATLIPRGSIATGIINWKTGKAIGGKSGKFEITFESLTANGRTVPLMGKHRQEGKGNTAAALFGSMLISGRSAMLQPGTIVNAMVKEPTTF